LDESYLYKKHRGLGARADDEMMGSVCVKVVESEDEKEEAVVDAIDNK